MAKKLEVYKCDICGNMVEVIHAHPMEEKHWIEWVQIIADGKSYRQFLNPGDAPEAFFKVDAAEVSAREYCNLHGVWKS